MLCERQTVINKIMTTYNIFFNFLIEVFVGLTMQNLLGIRCDPYKIRL